MVNSKIIQQLLLGHGAVIQKCDQAERYYRNQNDIKRHGIAPYRFDADAAINPLKMADNRVSHNWHALLVNQKVGYLLTYPPTFDVGKKSENQRIADALGDDFARVGKNLGITASNTGAAWLHYWADGAGKLHFAEVDPRQIVPVYSGDLEAELIGVLRAYRMVEADGTEAQYCEYWDKNTATRFRRNGNGNYAWFDFNGQGHTLRHGMGEVPFIPFYNNQLHTSDLDMYKDLIDAYDKTVSGFVNDMEDVQEIIFVLKNYGGTDKEEFVRELNLKKLIKVEGDGGVDTIRAEIPFEARSVLLERLRKQIFVSGMGVDPDPEKFGNASGVALSFLYSLLELKAGLMETEFRGGFSKLVRAVCRHLGIAEPQKIVQTWTRNAIHNDSETADIAAKSIGVISEQSILKNHPWVEDAEQELKQLQQEAQEAEQYRFPEKQDGGPPDEKP